MTAEKNVSRCTQCSKEFKYDSERRRHEKSHSPQFKCKVCSKTFSFVSALRRHEKQHERTGTAICNLCGKTFRDDVLLKRHMKYAHEGSYSCTKCDSVFHSEPALRTHMRTHKAEAERRYQCSFEGCGKKFDFAHHLKHHELTHTNTKQHFCKICDKGFIQSHHLKTHLKTHSVDFSLKCTFPDCDKKFTTEFAKARHMVTCHIKAESEISSDCNSPSDLSISIMLRETSLNDDDNAPMKTFKPIISQEKGADNVSMVIAKEKYINNLPDNITTNIDQKQNCVTSEVNNDHNDVNNCELAVGSCIMKEKGENCVCVEISDAINDDYDFTPIEADTINTIEQNFTTNDSKAKRCCGGHCSSDKCNDENPEIEYTVDGIVKIKEFLDADSLTTNLSMTDRVSVKASANAVPYNSCKDILGRCIVSGSGTIGDECLCAKMNIDEQMFTAQEIEDITPYPK